MDFIQILTAKKLMKLSFNEEDDVAGVVFWEPSLSAAGQCNKQYLPYMPASKRMSRIISAGFRGLEPDAWKGNSVLEIQGILYLVELEGAAKTVFVFITLGPCSTTECFF